MPPTIEAEPRTTKSDILRKGRAFPHCAAASRTTFLSLLLIKYLQPGVAGIGLDRRLIHQLSSGRRGAKISGHLDTQRILESSLAVKVVNEQYSPVITKLALAIPISPLIVGIAERQPIGPANLFGAGWNWILNHQVLRPRAFNFQTRDDQVARAQLS